MTIALKSDKKTWYVMGNNFMSYDTKEKNCKTVSYTRHKASENIETFKDRMISILVKASQGRKI